jgi:hypothetical protein
LIIVFVRTSEEWAVAAGHSVDPAGWAAAFEELMARIAGRFARREPRVAARAFVQGLLCGLERKTCWSIAEQAGPDVSVRFCVHRRLGRRASISTSVCGFASA